MLVGPGDDAGQRTGAEPGLDSSRRPLFAAMVPAMLAIGASAAANTAFLPWMPELVEAGLQGTAATNHDMHVAILSALFPLGGMVSAPLAGVFADRQPFRLLLVMTVAMLALATALAGATSLAGLYALRIAAGLAFGAVVPLCLLIGQHVSCNLGEQARIFTGLTASLFLGDFAGPLLSEVSAHVVPSLPLLVLGVGIGLVAALLAIESSDDHFCKVPSTSLVEPRSAGLLLAFLLSLTLIATGGLAAVHLSLVLHRSAVLSNREHVAWLLSLCGLAMLGAQRFHVRFKWLVDRAVALSAGMLIMQAAALWQFSQARSGFAIMVSIFAAGWSAATLRLVARFWISVSRDRSGLRLGIQQGMASIGQVAVPLTIAFAPRDWHSGVLWTVIALCLFVLIVLPLAWRRAT